MSIGRRYSSVLNRHAARLNAQGDDIRAACIRNAADYIEAADARIAEFERVQMLLVSELTRLHDEHDWTYPPGYWASLSLPLYDLPA